MSLLPALRSWLMAVVAVLLGAVALGLPADAADPLAGSQGTDTSLPLTDSAVTVKGRGEFADLEITINQTRNLTNQAVSITWAGAAPTVRGPGRFAANFLQIFQCWGDDDGTQPGNPGPPAEQCAMGAPDGVYGGVSNTAYPNGRSAGRVVSVKGWENFEGMPGFLEQSTSLLWAPFRAVNGVEIASHLDPDFTPNAFGSNYWLNPFFNSITSNEISGATTNGSGRGVELFQVATGLENTGLGCGQRTQPVPGAGPKVPKCWVVVVPRSTPEIENAGTPFGGERANNFGVYTSPLSPAAWKNRIAVPLEFNPIDSPCSLASKERRLAGNELFLAAIASWQPALCLSGPLPPYSYAATGDTVARRQITNPSLGSPGMVVVQRPIPASRVDPSNPVVYAPVSASGVVVGFNVERTPNLQAPPEAFELDGVRVAEINLTPRLVAKLLTQSYSDQLNINGLPDYEFVKTNPGNVYRDRDFLQFNPEFGQLAAFETRNSSGLIVPGANSDAAVQVWEWILADPEARRWMGGAPDEWGMQVNPRYNVDAAKNSSGFAFASPIPESFPKADPYCYQGPAGGEFQVVPPPLCGTDWMPYARGYTEAAQMTQQAFDRARVNLNASAVAPSQAWRAGGPQQIGRRAFFSLTDTESASRFGVRAARLSQAGDNGPNRRFIAPDSNGLAAGLASMRPRSEPTVLEPVTDGLADGAYPLTALSYAVVAPLSLDQAARADYASFLEYAAGAGQVPGRQLGQLPLGYQRLTPALVEQTQVAAATVRTMQPPAAPAPAAPAPAAPPPAESTRAAEPAPTASTPPRSVTPPGRDRSASSTGPVAVEAVDPTVEITEVTEGDKSEDPVADVEVRDQTVVPATNAATTPGTGAPVGRAAVPVIGSMALLSALAALEITKRPRRAPASARPQNGTA